MDEKIIELTEKICIFLKNEDYYKLKKLLDSVKNNYPDFFDIVNKFEKRTLLETVGSAISSLTLGGPPLVLLGKKEEEKEKKASILEKRNLLKDEIKEFLDKTISSKESEFLNFLYNNI